MTKHRCAETESSAAESKAGFRGSFPNSLPVATASSIDKRALRLDRGLIAICVGLLLAIAVVFGQAVRFDFINYDDPRYVCENPPVLAGLTWPGVAWAFTQTHMMNWHPLSWLSHMADCQFFGRWAGGHHLTSIVLHAATAVLLFLVLRQMTGDLWPSALAAALFAIHPLRAESVAWVAERKDVLSGFFFMLTLAAYVRYVRQPFSLRRLLCSVAFFLCGLMAKPMLVTLPCVLLLLDWWPLGRGATAGPAESSSDSAPARRGRAIIWGRLLEKTPFVILAVAVGCVTALAQRQAIVENEYLSLGARVANALNAYLAYLREFFVPVNLTIYYPQLGESRSATRVAAASIILLTLTFLAIIARRQRPYLLFGWLWFLGMLAPVIGIVQVGSQAMADRYTYLPQIGLCVAVSWGAGDLAELCAASRRARAIVAAMVLAALMFCGWKQTSYWKDSETVWRRALACTTGNWLAHYNLGIVLEKRGDVSGAIEHYQKALENCSGEIAMNANVNLGNALVNEGRLAEGVDHYRRALEIQPNHVMPRNNLAIALERQGKSVEAMVHYQKVLEIQPDFGPAHYSLGNIFAGQGKIDEAIVQYEETLKWMPGLPAAIFRLIDALAIRGRWDEAARLCEQSIEGAESHGNTALAAALRERLRRCQIERRSSP